MPSRLIESSSPPPTISSPSQLASQSRQDVSSAIASTSRTVLQATPESSFSNKNGFTIGSVVKISNVGVRRSRNAAVFASSDQGVVIVDPTTQIATSSYSFSPSLQPITPPLVIQTTERQSAIICLASKNESDAAEVHVWTQKRDSSSCLEEEVKVHTAKIDATARSLHTLLDGSILVHHANGELLILSGLGSDEKQNTSVHVDLDDMPEQIWTHHISVLDKFAATSMTKASKDLRRDAMIIRVYSTHTSSLKSKVRRSARKSAMEVIDAVEGAPSQSLADQLGQGKVRMEILAIEDDNTVKLAQSLDVTSLLDIQDAKEIRDVALFHSGRLVFSIADGRIVSTSVSLQADDNTICLESTSTIVLSANLQHDIKIQSVSLQLISASTAILILVEPMKDTITALLIDVDLASVLSSTSWSTKGVETVSTHRIAGSAVLVLTTCNDATNRLATNLWTCPYTISDDNHLRWALKSADLTRKWIGAPKGSYTTDESETGRKQLLKEIERILANKKDVEASNAIDEAFDKWHSKETSRLESIWLSSIEKEMMQTNEASSDTDEDVESKKRITKANEKMSRKAPLSNYPTRFVSALLDFALPTILDDQNASQKKSVYAKRTVHHLLSARAISHGIRKNILSTFQALEDWDGLLMTLRLVHDIPEMDVIQTLHQVVKDSQRTQADSKGRLDAFMTVFTSIALNHSQLRAALKTCLQDLDEVIIVMNNLSSWLKQTQESLLQLQPFQIDQNGLVGGGAKRRRKQVQNKKRLFIKMDKVLHLLCDLLDTYFPLFLNTESSQLHLKRLSQQIDDQLTISNQLMILQGPLAAFAQLQADQEKEARLKEEKKQLQDADEDLMTLKKADKKAIQAKENRIGQVGGGIGKNQFGEKSRRRQMYEENVAVGLYSLERLEI